MAVSVGYAGLASACFGNPFDTTMSGVATERALADGRAEDTVLLLTQNALTWVVHSEDVVNGSVVFGHRWNTNSPVCTLNGAFSDSWDFVAAYQVHQHSTGSASPRLDTTAPLPSVRTGTDRVYIPRERFGTTGRRRTWNGDRGGDG